MTAGMRAVLDSLPALTDVRREHHAVPKGKTRLQDKAAEKKLELVDDKAFRGDWAQLDTSSRPVQRWNGQGGVASFGLVALLGLLACLAIGVFGFQLDERVFPSLVPDAPNLSSWFSVGAWRDVTRSGKDLKLPIVEGVRVVNASSDSDGRRLAFIDYEFVDVERDPDSGCGFPMSGRKFSRKPLLGIAHDRRVQAEPDPAVGLNRVNRQWQRGWVADNETNHTCTTFGYPPFSLPIRKVQPLLIDQPKVTFGSFYTVLSTLSRPGGLTHHIGRDADVTPGFQSLPTDDKERGTSNKNQRPIRGVLGVLALVSCLACISLSRGRWWGLLAGLVCSGCGFVLLFADFL